MVLLLVSSLVGPSGCDLQLADITVFERAGGCTVQTSQRQAQGLSFTIFTPTAGPGCAAPFPVVGWGNGSFTNTTSYTAFLTQVASHGFTVVSPNVSNANGAFGDGGQTLLDEAINLGLTLPNVGTQACAMGYSQGGSAAIRGALLANARCAVGIAAEIRFTGPANASGLTRVVLLGGSADTTAPVPTNSQVLFNQADDPKVLAVLGGVGHLEPLGDGGRYRGLAISALVLNLRSNDPNVLNARSLFNGGALADDPRVATFTRQGTF